MDILVVGAGPAGLAFAIAHAQRSGGPRITVVDRRSLDASTGFGVTLRSGAFESVGLGTLVTGPALEGRALWYRGDQIVDLPNPDAGHLVTVARDELVGALRRRAEALGVTLRFGVEGKVLPLEDYDLVVAADGSSSALRARFAEVFRPTVEDGGNVFAWLGTTRVFRKLSVLLRDDDVPLLAWAYQYAEHRSTLIVEVSADTFARSAIDTDTASKVEHLLGAELDGHRVLTGPGPRWQRFPNLRCARLVHDNVVLVGDAAHTTHFSQGFGTLFALDDANVLAESIAGSGSLSDALQTYEQTQQPKVEAYQATCTESMRWGESVTRALDARDDATVRQLVRARWPDNTVTPGPLDAR